MILDPWILALAWINLVGGGLGLLVAIVLEVRRALRRRAARRAAS